MYVKELDILLTMKVFENTPGVLSLGKLCDENRYSYEWINCQKPHLIKNEIRIQCNTENFVPIADSETRERGDLSGIDSHPVPVSSPNVEEMIERRDPLFAANPGSAAQPTKNQKPNKEETTIERGDPLFAAKPAPLCSDIQEWLQEFREILVDDEVPERRDSRASSSHEVSLEPTSKRREELGGHSVITRFSEDRNCQICQRTKITWAPCRRRNGGAVPRAENFGDLITADYKVLSENCESRNNHRYAIVVQDLATQWIQSYPCKTKT